MNVQKLGADAVDVRPETPDDFPAIAEVIVDAFGGEHGPVVTGLVERIRQSAYYVPDLAVVAEDASGLLGHVMLSWVGIEGGVRDRLLNLSPMSVRSDRQRTGIGTLLIRTVLRHAEAAGEPAVMVEGIPSYYPRFGFERASLLGFQPPHAGIPDAAFMVRRLPAYHPAVAGRVVYPPAFAALGG